MSDAHLATLAAIHGHGIALCDSVTGTDLLSEGRLIMPLDLTIPAPEAFYLVYRRELRRAPIVRAFIEWLFAETRHQSSVPQIGGELVLQSPNTATEIRKGARRRVRSR
jgi:LysR family glycine cleavage system transcriptional activator